MVKSDDCDYLCPLCCEEFDISDREFYPCKCGYQVCMWCWHRIRESESGLCPACRTPYGEDPHQFSAVDVEEVLKANKEREAAAKREKHVNHAIKDNDPVQSSGTDSSNALSTELPKDRSQLANMRVIRRNLIYVVGLPSHIAVEEILRKPEYFGQYGKIAKIVINRSNATASSAVEARRVSASAYVTFQHKEDTLACILALDGFYLENRAIRASYGTSKYCSAFIKNVRCNNPECTYLHEMGAAEDTFTKQEIQAGYVTSGRDVIDRQQQILAEQLRLQQVAAGGGIVGGVGGGTTSHSLPCKRIGGGGPSGTGKAATNPIFPPPQFDEPSKPAPSVPVAPTTMSKVSTVPNAPSNVTHSVLVSKAARPGSAATTSKSTNNQIPTTSNNSAQTSLNHRKPHATAIPSMATAASVVAGGRKENLDAHHSSSVLTTLTPLKRSAIVKSGSTGTTKPTVSRSASSSPLRSSCDTEKMPGLPTTLHGKKVDHNDTLLTGCDQTETHGSSALLNEPQRESSLTIGGEVIGQVCRNTIGVDSGAIGRRGLDTQSDSTLFGSISMPSQNGIGSLGGLPIPMPDSRPSHLTTSLTSTLGGEIFNGPLMNDYHPKTVIGSTNDKWNGSIGVGGLPLSQTSTPTTSISNVGGARVGHSGSMWLGGSSTSGSNGVIGGQRFSGNNGGTNSTSALASILGINLPTGTGSLQESTSLWSSGSYQPQGPSPISTLNVSSMSTHQNSLSMNGIGSTINTNNAYNNNNGASLIGGVPIGGGRSGGYHGHGAIGAGNKKSDIALLQSLLPGVHITSDSSNPLMGFGSNSGGWGLGVHRSHNGHGADSSDIGGGIIRGDPIHNNANWVGATINLPGHRSTSIGAVGQQNSSHSQRQQDQGIW